MLTIITLLLTVFIEYYIIKMEVSGMIVKELRKITGLTQKEFAGKYQIPLQTLKQWESAEGSTSFRKPPEYVTFMLGRLVLNDYGHVPEKEAARVKDLIRAAQDSRYHAKQWLRYLRKELVDGKSRLTALQIECFLESDEVTLFQKVSLKRAMQQNTTTNRRISELNKRAEPKMLDAIRRKHRNADK